MSRAYICRACEREADVPDNVSDAVLQHRFPGEERYSLGIYAGMYCDAHWKASGYRDEPASGFDPADAGESYEAEP